ncbi:DUF938 domain-containing protein [Amorphus sp. 3PC139-8]
MRNHAPAADRNKEAILAVLRKVLPPSGEVLEIASGTGQHIAHFAENLPALSFQPSEPDVGQHTSIHAWATQVSATNVRAPIALDVIAGPWPEIRVDAVLSANMIHIAPWAATPALMQGAARILRPGGVLVLYGPYLRDGHETAPSNLAFDADLKARNPSWGLRRLEDVEAEANKAGFELERVEEMPANNLTVVFRKS